MASLVSNLNEINNIKLQIRDVIGTESYNFAEFPALIETAIITGGGGSYILSYYVTKEELSECGYLSSIPSEYITQEELSACGYISSYSGEFITQEDLSACGYLTENTIPVWVCTDQDLISYLQTYEYITQENLNNMSYITPNALWWMSYITMDDVSACSYITMNDVSNCGYITINDIPVIDLSSYVTKTELSNQSYASQTYVTDKIAEIPSVDLSAYVTKTELSNQSYLTTIPAEYITDSELSSCGYATETYVANYVDTHGGGGSSVVIDENIIPKENNTYTLGDSNHLYAASYTNRINSNDNGLWIRTGSNNVEYFTGTTVRPASNNTHSNGTLANAWKYTYSYYVGTYGSGMSIDNAQGLVFSINNNNRLYLGNSQFRPLTNNYLNFGTSAAKWKCVYTYDIYVDTQSISDIYTTYSYVYSVVGDIETLLANI